MHLQRCMKDLKTARRRVTSRSRDGIDIRNIRARKKNLSRSAQPPCRRARAKAQKEVCRWDCNCRSNCHWCDDTPYRRSGKASFGTYLVVPSRACLSGLFRMPTGAERAACAATEGERAQGQGA